MSRGEISLPFGGRNSSCKKHQTSLSERQMRMICKLEEVGSEFLKTSSSLPVGFTGSGRKPVYTGTPDPSLNRTMEERLRRYHESRECQKVLSFRETLPVAGYKAEIHKHVSENQVFVLSGETGCGKTTQITQFILDHAIQAGRGSEVSIVCTQPRRVAAITVAERVAFERGEELGTSVGYQVKMDTRTPRKQGSILYCTAGILLQRLQSDRNLLQFSHIILDEVHERDVMTDIILVLLKEVLVSRPDVKVILMSATLNGSQFSAFFQKCPVLHIPGFMHPVQSYYIKEVLEMIENKPIAEPDNDDEDYQRFLETLEQVQGGEYKELENIERYQINIIAALVQKIHSGEEEGAILIFLPGWEDICRLSRLLGDLSLSGVSILQLHGSMSHDDQRLIFQKTGRVRKIVIGTNIAESSVTIDDVVFVIDCGRAKMKMFDPKKNVATLKPEWIGKANSTQRKGRAGRLRPGKVYKIFSQARESTFREYMLPEVLRTRLENVILKIKILGFTEVDEFMRELMDPPVREAIELANQTLLDIGAINSKGELTVLGGILANLATDPQLGKMMILSCAFSCLDPILTIVSALEYKSPFHLTKARESAKAIQNLSADTMSDHLAVANAYAGWCCARMNRKTAGCEYQALDFCRDNCISQGVLYNIEKMKAQYTLELFKLGLISSKDILSPQSNAYSGVESVVRAVLTASLVPNIAIIQSSDGVHSLQNIKGESLEFHSRSVNRDILSKLESSMRFNYIPRFYAYFEEMHTSCTFLNDTTSVNILSLVLLASNIIIQPQGSGDATVEGNMDIRLVSGNHSVRLLSCTSVEAEKIEFVRSALERILQGRLVGEEKGTFNPNSAHGKVLTLLVRILESDTQN